MNELRYPVGIQTFSDIIEEGYAYVDKTDYIKLLLSQGKFIFLSRPRRTRGRSDIEVIAGRYIYVFEFKYNKSVAEAMDQIHSRDYAGRYTLDSRTVYLIGANYSESKERRGLEYEVVRFKESHVG